MGLDITLTKKKELSYEPSTQTTYSTSQVIWEGRGRDLGYSILEFTDDQLGCPLSVEELKELKEYLQQDLDSDDDFTKERKILGKSDQLGSPACGKVDLFLGSREIALRVRTAGELHGRRQEITHRDQSSVDEMVWLTRAPRFNQARLVKHRVRPGSERQGSDPTPHNS